VTPFLHFIEFLVAIGLLTALVSNYLIINKLWKRRATREVAESISIVAALLGLSTSIPFLIHFMWIEQSWAGAIKTSIAIVTGCVFVAIGSGIWVPEYRRMGFRRLFLRALNLERKESTHLLKQLVQPKGADRILKVLTDLASVDGHVDEKEAALIRDFAREWRLEEPDLEGTPDHVDLMDLRASVERYLEVGPPPKQAGQLMDLLQLLAEADDRVTWQEAVALEEVGGMLGRYVAGEDQTGTHEVLIVPQNDRQVEAVRTLLPDREEKILRGGQVFSVGQYFSERYAEVVCQKYIALGLFTTRVSDGAETRDLPVQKAEG
jgi:hypothetical protein